MDLYVLSYARPVLDGRWTGMCVGHYSSLARLEEAKDRLRRRPGFRDYPEGFYVNSYRMDEEYDDPMFFTRWDPRHRPIAVLGEAIGLHSKQGPFTVLLPRKTVLPASFASVIPTDEDDKTVGRVRLMAGDGSPGGDVRELGQLAVADLAAAPESPIRIPIWVAVDERGRVLIAARHPRTGEVLSAPAGTVVAEPGGPGPGPAPDGGKM
jgi:hypothetical protein